MARIKLRIRVDERGALEVIDPGVDTLPLLLQIDPSFRVRCATLRNFTTPRFMRLRKYRTGIFADEAKELPLQELWAVHGKAMNGLATQLSAPNAAGLSLLEIKALIATRLLDSCRLCARHCEVDRTRGKTGPCGLGTAALIAEHFVHIAEEAPINPSLILNMKGCALRCRYCQQHALLDVAKPGSEQLDASLWNRLSAQGARSMSFVGGNPDESMHAILNFLDAAPLSWNLPVVWNNHAYMSEEGLRLLDGIVDCYLPDLKYYDQYCGARLSGVSDYPEIAKSAIQALLHQEVPVIVRILVLPGHLECCHLPALRWLAEQVQQQHLYVSVRGQYSPDWQIKESDGLLARRATREEIIAVTSAARQLSLQLIA